MLNFFTLKILKCHDNLVSTKSFEADESEESASGPGDADKAIDVAQRRIFFKDAWKHLCM